MIDEQPKQSVQSAWVLRLRREAERMKDDDMSRILYVGLLIATYTNAEGGDAWPAPATLAGISGYSVDMVRRCIGALIGVGLLARRRRQNETSILQLLLPATSEPLDWRPHLFPFWQAREAAARRRAKSAANTAKAVATGTQNTHRDGASKDRTPVASGNSEDPSRRGVQDPEDPSRHQQNTRRVGELRRPVASGGYLDQSSTFGRDPDNDLNVAWPVAQPQVRAREDESKDPSSPQLQAIEGGGHGQGGGQAPLLLSVHTGPAAPLDHALIAAHMASLYGVPVPVRTAATSAVRLTDGLDLPDPTAYVLQVLDADPDTHRPDIPDARRRAAGDS